MNVGRFTGVTLGGRYTLGALLGQGGWGAVHVAVQNDLGRQVAIKILHADVAADGDRLTRFEREARAAAALGHPNIAQVTDFVAGSANEPPFLVMELLTGQTLGALLRAEGKVAVPRLAAIAQQILAGLEAAHGAGIVHRDIKPDNVFLVAMPGVTDFVKILDFGIAKLVASEKNLTAEGALLGSPSFMAPEQIYGGALDPRADLYALGATMYLAASGRYPFVAENMHALLRAIVDRPAAPLDVVEPAIDRGFAAVVARAMARDPQGRFGSAAEMRAALEPWARAGTSRSLLGSGFPIAAPVASTGAGTVVDASRTEPSSPVTGPSKRGAPLTPRRSSPVGLLVGIVVALLLVSGVVVTVVAFVVLRSAKRAATSAGASADPATVASSSAPPPCLVAVGCADAGPAATLPPPPAPSPVVPPDAKPGPVPIAKDAGAPADAGPADAGTKADAGARVAAAGTSPRFGGGSFEGYLPAEVRKVVDRELPSLRTCYVATEFEAPDHRYTSWSLTIDASGAVTSARRTTSFDPHPKLDGCVIGVFRRSRWPATPKGGTARIELTAEPRGS